MTLEDVVTVLYTLRAAEALAFFHDARAGSEDRQALFQLDGMLAEIIHVLDPQCVHDGEGRLSDEMLDMIDRRLAAQEGRAT
jgi:hypothetical protein